MDLDETLPRLACDPAAPADLAALALALAREEYPQLDPADDLARLDQWARLLRPRLAGAALAEQVEQLADFLFVELGFLGNKEQYYDPRNSYLNDVIARRAGIPITLSILAIAIGRRAGMRVEGVALPGHFIAKAAAAEPGQCEEFILFDPFHGGRWLTPLDCEVLSSRLIGVPFHFGPKDFSAASPAKILSRLLNNLRALYLKMEDHRRAARVLGRMRQLQPCDLTVRRDLGLCLLRQQQPGAAAGHLQAYLQQEPLPADAELAKQWLREARRELARWN